MNGPLNNLHPVDYPGIDGFLGWRGSLMMDVVFLAMFAIVPLLCVSIALVRYRKKYVAHKRIQISLSTILAVAVLLFEIDVRMYAWQPRAEPSPYYATGWVNWALWIHLPFAISTAVLWIYVLAWALRNIPHPPRPGAWSARHRFWARLAALDMLATAITGCTFYFFAFIAS